MAKNELQIKSQDVTEFFNRHQDKLVRLLPKGVNADRIYGVIVSCIQNNPKLLACTKYSLFKAALESAKLGLDVGGYLGHAYIIPYGNQAQFQIDYKGLLQLVYRNPNVVSANAGVVREKDTFIFEKGTDEKLSHVESREPDRGEITYYYAYVKMANGGTIWEVMSRAEVEEVRDTRSKAYRYAEKSGKKDSPWHTDPIPMGKKTVIHRLRPRLPLSVEILATMGAMDEDGVVESFDLPPEKDITPEEEALPIEAEENETLPQPLPTPQPDTGKKKSKSTKKDKAQKPAEEKPEEPVKEVQAVKYTCCICEEEKDCVTNAWGERDENTGKLTEKICEPCAIGSDQECDKCGMPLFAAADDDPDNPLIQEGEDWLCKSCRGGEKQ
ncbi:MAG: recombinase RecT [bacterium]